MRIKTKPYGEVEINEANIIKIVDGLFGFPGLENYVFLESKTEGPFLWLQSLDEPGLAFVVIRPEEFKADYKLSVALEDIKSIGLESPDEAVSIALVVIPPDPKQMTANLQGPIVLNVQSKIARQMISLNPEYKIKHHILDEMKVLLEKTKEGMHKEEVKD
ncbi:MAG: flagellar assembly protein FliW [Candidatus Hydrogenedentota bacterium]